MSESASQSKAHTAARLSAFATLAFARGSGAVTLTAHPFTSTSLDRAMRAHAERSAPDECVGALLGVGDDVVEVLELINASPSPHTSFEVSAAEYLRAERHAAARGLELLGFYHSHVDAPAVPSARDLEHAAPFARLIILSVREGKAEAPVDWSHRRSTGPADG